MFGHGNSDDQTAQDNTMQPGIEASMQDTDPQEELTLPQTADTANEPSDDAIGIPSNHDIAPPTAPPAPLVESIMSDFTVPTVSPVPDGELSDAQPIGISGNGAYSNLTALKQDALRELSPLIGELDQTPAEKYATAKMIYEETKDQNILKAVYEAAKNLPDNKSKAEAIYDVVQKLNTL